MEKMKRICSVTTVYLTMDPFILTQMKYMQERGWDVTIISNMKPSFIERIPKGFHYYNIPMERSFNLWTAIKCTWKLVRIFRKEKFDIVQYAATHAALYSSFASWVTRTPIRVHLQWGIYNYSEMGLSGKFYKFVEWLTCKFSTVVRPVSHKNMDIAVDEGLFRREKGKVLGEGGTVGIDLNDYPLTEKETLRSEIRKQYGIPEENYVFGFVGRISTAKGNNELLSAFKRVQEKNDKVTLLMVGQDEGSVDRSLMSWATENANVVLTGGVLHDNIPKYLAAMDCMVHPTYREGFGMVLQEAMAMAVPIITTDIPGPSEVIEEGKSGILIQPKNEEAVFNALNEAVDNKEKFVEFGQSGRARAEKYFSRPVMVERIYQDKEELYHNYNK